MQQKTKKLLLMFFAFILTISLGVSVLADDDEHEKKDHEKTGESYEKPDDEEYKQGTTTNTVIQEDYWYIWSRKPINNPNNSLPIAAPAELSVIVNGNSTKLYFIPRDGQLLVSGEKIASLLGAQAQYYSQSKILVMNREKYELIVRADSNAAYENRTKNPMPVLAAPYENTVYLPVSVAANALGYRLTWDPGSSTLICVSI